jgi:hypothetical protein
MTTPTPFPHTTREAWLMDALPSLVHLLDQAGAPAFPLPLISVGFPFGKRGGKTVKAIGQCWTLSDQERAHIFVHPCLDEAVLVLDVLMHELVHAAVGCTHGHRGPFVTLARAVGLEGPAPQAMAGETLRAKLRAIVGRVGPFPHRALDPQELAKRKRQGTRMRKYTCPGCGQILRAATDGLRVQCVPCSTEAGPVLYELHSQAADIVREGGG